MKVLWLSHFIPFPPKGGAYQRSYNLLMQLSKRANVDLIAIRHKSSTHPKEAQGEAQVGLGKVCQNVTLVDHAPAHSKVLFGLSAFRALLSTRSFTCSYLINKDYRRAIREHISSTNYDYVHFDSISLASYLGNVGTTDVIMNHHGPEGFMMHRRVKKERNILKKFYFWLEAKKLLGEEAEFCRRFGRNLVVSPNDASILGERSPGVQFDVVDNGVDVDYFSPQFNPESGPVVIFAGRLDQYSNRNGIIWFAEHVWPLISEKHKSAKLVIIGKSPPPQLDSASERFGNLEILGFVDDIRPYFGESAVVAVPIWDGGGTRIKVLDAMSMGMPIVATPVALEGLDHIGSKDLIVADDAESFAEATSLLLSDRIRAKKLGDQARRTVESSYSWESIGAKLHALSAGSGELDPNGL